MKKSSAFRALALPVIFALFSIQLSAQNAWINEFHYDNASTDVGEFIEVVLENAGDYTLSDFTVTFYNGSNGTIYGSATLADFTSGTTDGNFTIYYYAVVLQNGAPDGFSLDYQGTVIQFLNYEGTTFVAVGGPADGMTSTNVGVAEGSSTPVGYSLQLQGEGSTYADFTWAGPMENTEGTVNTGQTLLSIVATPLSDWALVIGIMLIGVFTFIRFRRNG